ncbi:hypothetical protein NBM05_03655 [Rothia sp. AR01]|uniref:Uncharacterized protein n=1 Tax=Rothia santali TaxID=2949643 RepID=A0A9X2H8R8_9MICC|nr:hypothetical protein [Rothia santali]MCP3425144.1 hypothetical protein [Rothia santali]
MYREVETVAAYAVEHATPEQIAGTLRVLELMAAPAHTETLARAMSTDAAGNPLVDTPERAAAQHRWSSAQSVQDQIEGLREALASARDRRDRTEEDT